MLLLIDNYDSFTYNLYQYLSELGADVEVVRNDEITAKDCLAMEPERIVVSPGPCTPAEAGVSVDLIREAAGKVPLLGVCLGHQSIGAAFGARVESAGEIMHGKLSTISHDGRGVLAGLPAEFQATRYHSLVVARETLPECLEVTAWTTRDDGTPDEIMGVRHREHDVEGVQFHPESIMTPVGHDVLRNFLAPSLGESSAAGDN